MRVAIEMAGIIKNALKDNVRTFRHSSVLHLASFQLPALPALPALPVHAPCKFHAIGSGMPNHK